MEQDEEKEDEDEDEDEGKTNAGGAKKHFFSFHSRLNTSFNRFKKGCIHTSWYATTTTTRTTTRTTWGQKKGKRKNLLLAGLLAFLLTDWLAKVRPTD